MPYSFFLFYDHFQGFLTTQEDILKNQVEEKNKQTVKEEETEKEHSNLSADEDLNYGRKFSLKLNPVLNNHFIIV